MAFMSQPIVSRAPFHMKYSRKSDFEPEFVSIGLYYYGKKLHDNHHMDAVKEHCTLYFLKKMAAADGTNPTLDDLVIRINPYDMETKILDWYGGSIDLLRDDLFRILVRDSCFVIRIVLSISREVHDSMFFRLGVDIKKVRFDMLLLENQIPFFFLLKVYDFFNRNEMLPPIPTLNSRSTLPVRNQNQYIPQSPSLLLFRCLPPIHSPKKISPHCTQEQNHLLKPTSKNPEILDQFLKELEPFIGLDMPWKFNNEYGKNEKPNHLLHLYWKCCLPFPWRENDTNPPRLSPNKSSNECNQGDDIVPESWVNIHLRSNACKRIKNAYELYRRNGVKFQKRQHKNGFGVIFQKGVLQLPHLQLDRRQTKLLINLIAFEESKPSKVRVLTSYVLLLDGLINTEKDVELLQRHGVITNKLGSSQIASAYFNDIGIVCSIDYRDHYCHQQFDDLNRYYNSPFTRQWAKLRHNYFNSPWAVISFLAGSALLISSAAQTYYTISSYYQHH